MNNLFLNNLAEIKISYSSKIPAKDRHKVTCSRDASEILRLAFEDLEYRESFYILLLNRANQVLGYNMVSLGGISGTITDIRLIFQTALKASSVAIILAHYVKLCIKCITIRVATFNHLKLTKLLRIK